MRKSLGEYKVYFTDLDTRVLLPYYEFGLHAGFPSPAADYQATSIDLNMALLLDIDNTRTVEVLDNDMSLENIFEGDLAILDTSFKPIDGDKIFCRVDGEDMFRKINRDYHKNTITLTSTNSKIPPLIINKSTDFVINGVVTYTITSHVPTHIFANGKREDSIDLNKLLVKNPISTFLGSINGESMRNVNILNGDLVIIDKSLEYINGYKALCRIEDKFTVKMLEFDKKDKNILWLMPANEEFQPIQVTNDKRVEVWGVIAYSITSHIKSFFKGGAAI